MIVFGKTQDAFQTPFDATEPAAIIVTINFSAQTAVSAVGLTLPVQPALSRIEVYVASGSFKRPFGVFWLNTVT